MIKIGIESTLDKLRNDLLAHPAKYFFILIVNDQAALCIRTCNSQGEDVKAHIVDGLIPDSKGDLISIFEDSIKATMLEHGRTAAQLNDGNEFNITKSLGEKISENPGLIDWIMYSVLDEDRSIVMHPFWTV